jgi:WD40 repeat protein
MSTETSPFESQPSAEALRLETGAEPAPGYRLEKLLGRGGFGEVWRAQGPGGIAVAMKFIRGDGKGGGLEMRSLEMMKDVRHGNLLSLFGVWQREPFVIFAMELADRSLIDRLHEAQSQGQTGIPLPELLEHLRDAARALDFLNEPRHTQDGKTGLSIQHRDIKPHNLLLVGDTVKLADFGLARLLERQATSHTGAMTPAYAAPEFFKGQTTSQSDQYSLAVSYCQLRGGRLPFTGSPEQMMMWHSQEAPDLTMLPEVERPIVARALSKQPGERWPSCRAFVQALAAIGVLSALPISEAMTVLPAAAVQTLLRAAPRRRRRWPWLVAGGLLLVMLLVGGGLALVSDWGKVERVAQPKATPLGNVKPLEPPKAPEPGRPPSLAISGVAITPDDRRLSVGADGVVSSWVPVFRINETDKAGMKQTPRRLHEISTAAGMVLSPDGRRFLADAANGVELWDVETGNKRRFVEFPVSFFDAQFQIHSKAFAPDGRRFIVGYSRQAFNGRHELLVSDLDGKTQLLGVNEPKEAAPCVALSAGGKWALSAGRDCVRIWDVEMPDTARQKIQRGGVISMAFSPDGKQALLGAEFDTLVLVDIETGKEVRSFIGHGGGVSCVRFSPDGKRALSGGWDKTVRLWDVVSGKQLECYRGPEAEVTSVAFSAGGTQAISGDKAGGVWVWNVPLDGKK